MELGGTIGVGNGSIRGFLRLLSTGFVFMVGTVRMVGDVRDGEGLIG
jgi:hypothetical protein